MFIVSMMSWWYGAGWRQRGEMMRERLAKLVDYFSLSLLIKTFFTPYRQLSNGNVRGPLDVKIRAFVDRLIARCIGAMIRSVIIVIGIVAIAFHCLIALIILGGWFAVPLLPIAGLMAFLTGQVLL